MRTLILNGSPRKQGDTSTLTRRLKEILPGETVEFFCYGSTVGGCVDCRYCWKNPGCCVRDGWQELEKEIQKCDNILIASPVYFFELTGKMLDVLSRVQSYWCARAYQKTELIQKGKKGGILLVGGGSGKPDRAVETATLLLRDMRCEKIASPILCNGTDRVPACENPQMEKELERLAGFFSSGEEKAEQAEKV